jgi:hypothetical protein
MEGVREIVWGVQEWGRGNGRWAGFRNFTFEIDWNRGIE